MKDSVPRIPAGSHFSLTYRKYDTEMKIIQHYKYLCRETKKTCFCLMRNGMTHTDHTDPLKNNILLEESGVILIMLLYILMLFTFFHCFVDSGTALGVLLAPACK